MSRSRCLRQNPFHSERVKSEVQLLRSRPLTLDEDGKRLCGDVDEQALGDPSWDGGVKGAGLWICF